MTMNRETLEQVVSTVRAAIMSDIISARNEQSISQRKLAEMSGIKQPVIARMENGTNSPQLDISAFINRHHLSSGSS